MNGITANCVFCEEVREEASGKLIFIGVISGGLLLERPKEERVLSLTQFIQIRGLKPGAYNFELSIRKFDGENNVVSAGLPGHFVVEPEDLEAIIVAEGLKVHLMEESILKASIQIDGSEPIEIGAFRIAFHPDESEMEDS